MSRPSRQPRMSANHHASSSVPSSIIMELRELPERRWFAEKFGPVVLLANNPAHPMAVLSFLSLTIAGSRAL